MSKPFNLMNAVWRLDDGETFKAWETKHARKMKALRIGTKVYTTDFYRQQFREDNGWKKWAKLDTAVIAGHARDKTNIRVRVKGYKTLQSMWVGFYDSRPQDGEL